jgi:hypothetical protein
MVEEPGVVSCAGRLVETVEAAPTGKTGRPGWGFAVFMFHGGDAVETFVAVDVEHVEAAPGA